MSSTAAQTLIFNDRTELARSVLNRFEQLILLMPWAVSEPQPVLNHSLMVLLALPERQPAQQKTSVKVQCLLNPPADRHHCWLGVSVVDEYQYDIEQRIRKLTDDRQQHYGKLLIDIVTPSFG